MKPIVYTPTVTLEGKELAINTNTEKKYGCYYHILKRMNQQLAAMLTYHSKVVIIRVDLHLHEYSPNNKLMSQFMQKFIKRAKRGFKVKRIGYAWVRELEKAKAQHYHLVLMLDGNEIQTGYKVNKLCSEIWEGWGQPKTPYIQNCAHMVKRDDKETYNAAFYRMSYLAKPRGKGYRAPAANDYFTSQIKPKTSIPL